MFLLEVYASKLKIIPYIYMYMCIYIYIYYPAQLIISYFATITSSNTTYLFSNAKRTQYLCITRYIAGN